MAAFSDNAFSSNAFGATAFSLGSGGGGPPANGPPGLAKKISTTPSDGGLCSGIATTRKRSR